MSRRQSPSLLGSSPTGSSPSPSPSGGAFNFLEHYLVQPRQVAKCGKHRTGGTFQQFLEDNADYMGDEECALDEYTDLYFAEEEVANCKKEVCAVCWEALEGKWVRRLHACQHLFCNACLTEWFARHKLQTKCPMCRQEI